MGAMDEMSMEEKKDRFMELKRQLADGTLSDAGRHEYEQLRPYFEE